MRALLDKYVDHLDKSVIYSQRIPDGDVVNVNLKAMQDLYWFTFLIFSQNVHQLIFGIDTELGRS
jgi:hypothetical protein